MKKILLIGAALIGALAFSHFAGAQPADIGYAAMALAGVGMINYVQKGDTLTMTPAAAVASGVGYLFGTGLFGVATDDVAINTPGEFLTEGVVTIAKTSALAISIGDRLFWDATNKCVNKTTTAQQCVGIAVADAANPSATVKMKLGAYVAVAA